MSATTDTMISSGSAAEPTPVAILVFLSKEHWLVFRESSQPQLACGVSIGPGRGD